MNFQRQGFRKLSPDRHIDYSLQTDRQTLRQTDTTEMI